MSAIYIRPNTRATAYPSRKSVNNHTRSSTCAKRLDFSFSGGFNCRVAVSCASSWRRERNTMALSGFNGMHDEGAFIENVERGGLQAALNSLSKWILIAVFGTIILWRRDAGSLWAVTGAVLNLIISTWLKKLLNQERPISTSRSDPGMPSSHAQSFFYTITFLNLSMVEFYGINGLTMSLNGLFFTFASYFSWLRVSQQVHTISQVIVGAALGSILSISWFWCWNAFVLNPFTSSLWVRIPVVLGAVGYTAAFLFDVFWSWILEERVILPGHK